MYLDIQGFLGIIGDKTRKRNSNAATSFQD